MMYFPHMAPDKPWWAKLIYYTLFFPFIWVMARIVYYTCFVYDFIQAFLEDFTEEGSG